MVRIGRTHIGGSVVCDVHRIFVLGGVGDHDLRVVRRRIWVDVGECRELDELGLQGMDSLIW